MNSYQIGYLVGLVVGAVGGGWLCYKLIKSPSKTTRRVGFVVGLIGLAYLASAALKAGPGRIATEFETGFRSGCLKKCVVDKNQVTCAKFCDCQVSTLTSGPDADQVIEGFRNVRTEADFSPEQRSRLTTVAAKCTPPELYDARFIKDCTQGCKDAECSGRCRCFLTQLRAGMDPRAGTEWLIRNVDSSPPTAEGEARAAAAIAACAPSEAAP